MTDTPQKPPTTARHPKPESAMPIVRSARNERQAEYQRAYRADQKRLRIPSRDDAARVALHWFITLNIENDNQVGLSRIHHEIVRRLVDLGFDQQGADRRVSDLIDRYKDGWVFQAKPHLRGETDGGGQS